MKKKATIRAKTLTPVLLLLLLAGLNLWWGSADLPVSQVWGALTGSLPVEDPVRVIVCEMRLPALLTAALAGSALAVTGLLMQTAFDNPLADPSILGVNAGAGLGAALALLCMGGGTLGDSMGGGLGWSGWMTVAGAAFLGAACVLLLLGLCAAFLRNHLMLLVAGVMVSYAVGAIVTLLSYFASADGLRSYVAWGMGDFSGVGRKGLPVFALLTGMGCGGALLLAKPLNALLLGEDYARNAGYGMRSLRWQLLWVAGGLTALCTAFCGPVAFIGLAVPHVARMMMHTADHRVLLPATMLWGAVVALWCHWLSHSFSGMQLPLNALTALMGVPIALLILVRNGNS